jgi:hypothetical protein
MENPVHNELKGKTKELGIYELQLSQSSKLTPFTALRLKWKGLLEEMGWEGVNYV